MDSIPDTSTEATACMNATTDIPSTPDTPAEDLLVWSPIQVNSFPMVVEGVELTALGLKAPAETELSPEQFNTLFCAATTLSRASNWILGDTLDLAERTWGNRATGSKYEEASRQTGMAVSTIRQIVCVCHNIPLEQRRHDLSFTHHLEACFKTDSVAEREAALDRASNEKTSVKNFRTELRKQRAEKLESSGEAAPVRDFVDELCSEEAQEAVKFPFSYELLKFDYWLQSQNLWKLDDDVRRRILDAAAPLMTRLYTLMQLELDENPEAEFDVPFEIKPGDFDINAPL